MYSTVPASYVMGAGGATSGGVLLAGGMPAMGPGVGLASADPMNHITMGIWIGGHKALQAAAPLLEKGIRQVVNTAIEFITETPELINWDDLARNGINVHNTYWDDTLAQPIFPTTSLEGAVKKIDEVVQSGGQILVNCAMGKSRSSSCVIAYLMARQGMGYDNALALIKRSRPVCQPNPNFERQLRQLEASLRSTYPITAPHAQNLSASFDSGAASPQGAHLRYASPNPHSHLSPQAHTMTRPVSPAFAMGTANEAPMPSSPRYTNFSSPPAGGVGAAAASSAPGKHRHSPFHSLRSMFGGHHGSSSSHGAGHSHGHGHGHSAHGPSGTVNGAASPMIGGLGGDVHGMHRTASMSGMGYGAGAPGSPMGHHGHGSYATAGGYGGRASAAAGGHAGQAWRPYGPTNGMGHSPYTPQPYRGVGGAGGMGAGYYDVGGMGRRLSL